MSTTTMSTPMSTATSAGPRTDEPAPDDRAVPLLGAPLLAGALAVVLAVGVLLAWALAGDLPRELDAPGRTASAPSGAVVRFWVRSAADAQAVAEATGGPARVDVAGAWVPGRVRDVAQAPVPAGTLGVSLPDGWRDDDPVWTATVALEVPAAAAVVPGLAVHVTVDLGSRSPARVLLGDR